MEEILTSHKADVVYMARALLADPFLPEKSWKIVPKKLFIVSVALPVWLNEL